MTETQEQSTLGDTLWRRALRQLLRDKLTLTAISVVALIVLLVLAAPLISQALGVDPLSTDASLRLLKPGTAGHILGTDELGRDYLSRLLYAGQISFAIGLSTTVLTLAIGIILGLIAGYFGGSIDDSINSIVTVLDSIPTIYLLILLSALLRPSPEVLVLILALTGWTGTTRLIRGLTLGLRGREYVVAAQAIGASAWRIMLLHLLPNMLSLILVAVSGAVAGVIISESTLSFLNLGVQPPTPTWGNMLTNARRFFDTGPHLAIISGVLIFVTVLCLYTIGDGLRDAFDPHISSK